MYASEILSEIIKADFDARAIYNSAINEREGFEALMEEHKKKLREEYFKKADEALAEHEKRETLAMNLAIEELDRQLASDLDKDREHFESIKQAVTDHIFDAVVDINA